MRLSASLDVSLPGDVVLREPTSWERVQRLFLPKSMAPELATEERRLSRDVVSLTEGLCTALAELEVNDAVYLAVDGAAVYYDAMGIPNDAERLLEAAKADSFGQPFDEVRAVFTQRREGIDFLYEATFQRRFRQDSPAATVSVCGRLGALRPQPGESVAEARTRLHSLLGDPEFTPSLRAFFDDTVARLRDSLARAFPDGQTSRSPTSTFVVRPSRKAVRELSMRTLADAQPRLRARPGCYHPRNRSRPYYDPWDCYYDDVGETWVDLAVISELMHATWRPVESLSLDIIDASENLLCDALSATAHATEFTGLSELASWDFCLPQWEQVSHLFASAPDLSIAGDGLPALDTPELFSSTPDVGHGGSIDLSQVDLGTSAMGEIGDAFSSVVSTIGDAASAAMSAASDAISSASDYDLDD